MRILNFALIFYCLIFLLSCTEKPSLGKNDRPKLKETIRDSLQTGFFDTYENTNRGIWQKPDLVIELLGDIEGKTIADIGAGRGFLARRLVEKAEKVIAIDIDPNFIAYLDSLKTQSLAVEFKDRLEPRLSKINDPLLQAQEVDAVIIVNTYMYMKDRIDYLKILMEGMKDGAKLLIIDFKKKQTSIGPPQEYRTPLYTVEKELKEAGFQDVSTNDSALDYQYIVMARKMNREL